MSDHPTPSPLDGGKADSHPLSPEGNGALARNNDGSRTRLVSHSPTNVDAVPAPDSKTSSLLQGFDVPDGAIVVDSPELPPDVSQQPVSTGETDAEERTHIATASSDGRNVEPRTVAQRALAKELSGQSLEHFELSEFIGGGGMGVVFRANDTRLKRIVALKVLSPEAASQPEILQRFRVEAESAARLDHQGIARVFYVGEDRGYHFLAFEFVDGCNLRDLVTDQGILPWEQALDLTFQIAKALEHASERGVVHRDIKPSNVLVTPAGRAKLVDMGLARLGALGTGDDLTNSGATLGTFDYISPEQAHDPRHADVRSDIYSLGCTLYFMLTGQPPFPDGTMLQKLLRHQGSEPTDIRELNSDVPDDVSRVLRRMLAKNPRSRQQSAREVLIDLTSAADGQGISLSDSTGDYRVAEPLWAELTRQHAFWLVPVVALVFSVVLLDVFWSRSRDSAFRPYSLLDTPPIIEPRSPDESGAGQPASAANDRGGSSSTPSNDGAVPIAPTFDSDNGGPFGGNMVDGEWSPIDQVPPTDANGSNANNPSGDATRPEDNSSGDSASQREDGTNRGDETNHEDGANVVTDLPPGEFLKRLPVELIANGSGRPPFSQSGTNNSELSGQNNALNSSPNGTRSARPSPRQLVVDPQGFDQPNRFATLKAALETAQSGDVIELRFNGRLTEAEPIRLADANMIIRAAEGYRPVVVFRPEDRPKRQNSMMAVRGNKLQIINVAFELDLSQTNNARGLSLFGLGESTLALDQCWLTIINAQTHQFASRHNEKNSDVRFVSVHREPATEIDRAAAAPMGISSPAQIKLEDCVVRGEGTFVNSDGLGTGIVWRNGILAVSGYLLDGVASGDLVTPLYTLDMEHVTAAVSGGLAKITTEGSEPSDILLLKTDISDSILIGDTNAVLLSQRGPQDVEIQQSQISWLGSGIFYEHINRYWEIENTNDPAYPSMLGEFAWHDSWPGSTGPMNAGDVFFANPEDKTALYHEHSISAYLLDDFFGNAALQAASDGQDAGAVIQALPDAPSEKKAPKGLSRARQFGGPSPAY